MKPLLRLLEQAAIRYLANRGYATPGKIPAAQLPLANDEASRQKQLETTLKNLENVSKPAFTNASLELAAIADDAIARGDADALQKITAGPLVDAMDTINPTGMAQRMDRILIAVSDKKRKEEIRDGYLRVFLAVCKAQDHLAPPSDLVLQDRIRFAIDQDAPALLQDTLRKNQGVVRNAENTAGDIAAGGKTALLEVFFDETGLSPDSTKFFVHVGSAATSSYPLLILATEKGHTDTVRLLLDRGADPEEPGTTTMIGLTPAALNTPLELAESKGFPQIIGMLKEAIEKKRLAALAPVQAAAAAPAPTVRDTFNEGISGSAIKRITLKPRGKGTAPAGSDP